ALEISSALGPQGSERLAERDPHPQSENEIAQASRAAHHRWHTSETPKQYATPDHPVLRSFNTVCWLEDWYNPAIVSAIRRELPYYVDGHPDFPRGFEHRKHWEYAQVVVGLEQLRAVHAGAIVL